MPTVSLSDWSRAADSGHQGDDPPEVISQFIASVVGDRSQLGPHHAPNFLPRHPRRMLPFGRAGCMTATGDEPNPFDWAQLVPQAVHPLRVAIVETLRWIDQPLSPSELSEVFDREVGTSQVSYHVGVLAKAGALVETGNRKVRGATQTFYFFPEAR